MTEQRYRSIFAWFRARPAALRALRWCQSGSVALRRDARLMGAVVVPATVFVAGTALRAVLNRPRPYEALGFDPLFPKDTKGKSMPSRHCFSAAAIAVTACSVSVPLGVLLWVLAVGIALTRVLTGRCAGRAGVRWDCRRAGIGAARILTCDKE